MAQVTVNSLDPNNDQKRANILQLIENKLDDKELENLGKIAKSPNAKKFLTGAGFLTIRGILKI